MNDDDEYTIHIDSFNNKGNKGDDDFETWMANEAPFVPEDATIGTLAEGSMAYTVDLSQHATCTSTMLGGGSTITGLSPTFTIKDMPHFAPTKQKKLPIDLLHKWYPEQMKEIDDE
tara:strand:+ start:25637 stop:25984 length:348 start_codon:yes stop_codon:yes gene_type:complete